MAASLIQQSADPFTDNTLEKLYLDPVLNAGSRFLFDFLNPISNPNPDGALPNGVTFKNLVEGGADAVYTANTGGTAPTIVLSNAANKSGLVSPGQNGGVATSALLSMGAAQPTGDKPFAVTFWLKQNGVASNQPGGAGPIGTLMLADALEANPGTGLTHYAWAFYSQPTPNVAQIGQRIGGSGIVGPTAPASTAARQLGFSWAAGQLTGYLNGAAIGSQAGIPSPIGATGVAPRLFMAAPGAYYRAYMERLDLSGRSAAAAVKADYDLNVGRFA